jgi:integrase
MRRQFGRAGFTLSYNEVKVIINSAKSYRDRCLIKCLYYAGLRRAEVVNLDVRDVDLQRRRIRVIGKGDKSRVVPLFDLDFMGDLKALIGGQKEGRLFPISIREVNWVVQKAGERSGIKHPNTYMKHINPHLFRHSISRHLKTLKFSLESIQNFMGHESFKTTMDMYGTQGVEEMQAEFDRKFGMLPVKEEMKQIGDLK